MGFELQFECVQRLCILHKVEKKTSVQWVQCYLLN